MISISPHVDETESTTADECNVHCKCLKDAIEQVSQFCFYSANDILNLYKFRQFSGNGINYHCWNCLSSEGPSICSCSSSFALYPSSFLTSGIHGLRKSLLVGGGARLNLCEFHQKERARRCSISE